jgi:hypothetical protein
MNPKAFTFRKGITMSQRIEDWEKLIKSVENACWLNEYKQDESWSFPSNFIRDAIDEDVKRFEVTVMQHDDGGMHVHETDFFTSSVTGSDGSEKSVVWEITAVQKYNRYGIENVYVKIDRLYDAKSMLDLQEHENHTSEHNLTENRNAWGTFQRIPPDTNIAEWPKFTLMHKEEFKQWLVNKEYIKEYPAWIYDDDHY